MTDLKKGDRVKVEFYGTVADVWKWTHRGWLTITPEGDDPQAEHIMLHIPADHAAITPVLPTLREQFDALPIGARFMVPAWDPSSPRIKTGHLTYVMQDAHNVWNVSELDSYIGSSGDRTDVTIERVVDE